MKTFARLAGLTLALLLLLLAASAWGHQWIKRESAALRRETIAVRSQQFGHAVALARLPPPPWDAETEKTLLAAVGAERLEFPPFSRVNLPGFWSFDYALAATAGSEPFRVRVWFAQPRTAKLLSIYQRAGLGLALMALTASGLVGVVLVLGARRTADRSEQTHTPLRADFSSLAGLAKVSVEQGAQLERERVERLRIQEDLNFQQVLLNRALEEKIRLGHDLHDGIIQSLYATGLTLEAAKKSAETDSAAARQQVESALEMLNRTIRDVRSYILGLAPDDPKEQSFRQAVESITATLSSGSAVDFDLQIDDHAASRLSENQYNDLVQIVREAVSNGVRHGKATKIGVHLQEAADETCLVVQDNGVGFVPERATRGHGLSNIESRAARLPARARCTSTPGAGTRLVVTFNPSSPV